MLSPSRSSRSPAVALPRLSRGSMLGLSLALALCATLVTPRAHAGTSSGSVQSSATLVSACNLAVSPLAFGTVSGLAVASNGQTSMAVTCTSSTAYSISMNLGTSSYANTNGSIRFMTGTGGAILPYYLYQDSAQTVLWSTGSNVYNGVGTGQMQTLPVYSHIQINVGGGTVVPVGVYADTVTVTLGY